MVNHLLLDNLVFTQYDHLIGFWSGTGKHSHGIRAGLEARGWFENPEHNSPHFEFKWASNPLDIDHGVLWQGQVVNHYSQAWNITTKVSERTLP